MTKPVPDRNAQSRSAQTDGGQNRTKVQASSIAASGSLSYQDTYICPVCRHGQITGLTLMEAFACNFCRHIFTANLVDQSVQVVDSSQPMTWRWNGRSWQVAYHDDPNLTMVVWVIGIVLVILPASIVWLLAYLFPPMPGSTWAWFPSLWVGCTFGIHLLMVSWLLAEHYQLPIYVASRIRLREWLGRR
jgi:rubredoxin